MEEYAKLQAVEAMPDSEDEITQKAIKYSEQFEIRDKPIESDKLRCSAVRDYYAGYKDAIKRQAVETMPDKPNWKQLRDKFFKECTETYEAGKGLSVVRKVSYNIAPHDLFEWFKRELQAVPAKKGMKWVKASELPEIGKWYLIHTVQCGVIEGFLDGGEDGRLWLAQSGDLNEDDTVTHWMPLPEPPSESASSSNEDYVPSNSAPSTRDENTEGRV
jgi:hypothetical protein